MNLERAITRQRIGDWDFLPASGELRRGDELRRLEPRAAKVLQLLWEARGEVVSHDQLIAEVWDGRVLSENSVAVVIGQLRKALGDDAREPQLIETIPKRGYRLRADAAGIRSGGRPGRLALLGLALLIAGFAAWTWSRMAPGDATPIAVSPTANETGDPRYAPLAVATNELIVSELGERGFLVRRQGPAGLTLASKIVIWDGLPYLGLTAVDEAGTVRWSSMSKATAGAVPPAVEAKLDEFARRFPPKEGGGRLANAEAAR